MQDEKVMWVGGLKEGQVTWWKEGDKSTKRT